MTNKRQARGWRGITRKTYSYKYSVWPLWADQQRLLVAAVQNQADLMIPLTRVLLLVSNFKDQNTAEFCTARPKSSLNSSQHSSSECPTSGSVCVCVRCGADLLASFTDFLRRCNVTVNVFLQTCNWCRYLKAQSRFGKRFCPPRGRISWHFSSLKFGFEWCSLSLWRSPVCCNSAVCAW